MDPSSAPTPSPPSPASGRRWQYDLKFDDDIDDDDDDDYADDNHDIDLDHQVRVCDPCTRDQEWRRKMHLVLDQLRASTLLTQVTLLIMI